MNNQNMLTLMYVFISILFSTFLGDYLIIDTFFSTFLLDSISNVIPSIKILELNSDFPLLTRRYLSFMWLLTPVFALGFLKINNGVVINKDFYNRKPRRYFLIVIVFLIVSFYIIFSIISSEVLAGASREQSTELIFMRKFVYAINVDRLALGFIMGCFFTLYSLMLAYFIVTFDLITRDSK